jgi:hypothetical protein
LEVLIVALLILLIWLLYFLLVQKPEDERQRKLREEKAAAFLAGALANTPSHIVSAMREGRKAYRAAPSVFFGQEFSPLVYFGYRTGTTKGRTEKDRREILQYCLAAEFPDFFPGSYRTSWGRPASRTRYRKVVSHIEHQIALKEGVGNAPVAVREWNSDVNWLRENFLWMAK